MRQTVICVFEKEIQAKSAIAHLVCHGFNRGDIDMILKSQSAENGFTDPFRFDMFYRGLLNNMEEANLYATIASMEEAIVNVETSTHAEALVVQRILNDCGALDVTEWARKFYLSKSSSMLAISADESRARVVLNTVTERERLREERVIAHSQLQNELNARKDLQELLDSFD